MSFHLHHVFTIHNHKAPTDQLPVELLVDIFYVGLQEYGLDDHHAIKYLSAISSTCSAWRDAALGTPSLWQRITYKERGVGVLPKSEGHAIPRHTKDRLLAYLSRSKDRNILLHLDFCASTLRAQAVKRIVYPHLPRCLALWLSFDAESDVIDFLPLPGNLRRLTEFTCVVHFADLDSPPPIFEEPEGVTLRKLTLSGTRPSLSGVGAQGLEDVLLMKHDDVWPEGAMFVSRCHSLTKLVISDYVPFHTDRPFALFTLPNLTHLDILGFEMLRASHTPNLQTLIIREGLGNNFDGTVVPMPSWPTLTTLMIADTDLDTAEIISLLVLNSGIKRLILPDCVGIHLVVQLLRDDNAGGAANVGSIALLPSLSLLQVWGSQDPDTGGFRSLFAHRPTLRIEHDEPDQIRVEESEMAVEELDQNDGPGVFRLRRESA